MFADTEMTEKTGARDTATMLAAFTADAEERGAVAASELETLAVEHDLDDDELERLAADLEERGVEVQAADAAGAGEAPAAESTVEHHVAGATSDSLQLFLNEVGRYRLLTAAEEIALAKRV